MTHPDTHTNTVHENPIHAKVTTGLEKGRIHRLVVQMGSRGSVNWRAVGHVVQTDDGLFAAVWDERFQSVWEHCCAPQPGVVESAAVMRFAALDGVRPVHIATVRVPQWLVNQLRHGRSQDRTLNPHVPLTGRPQPGGPRGFAKPWNRVEECARHSKKRRTRC